MMKKILFFGVILTLFAACEKAEVVEPMHHETTNGNAPEMLYASIADEQGDEASRTYLDGKQVLWHEDDAITYFYGSKDADNVDYTYQSKYIINSGAGTTAATFKHDETGDTYISMSDLPETYAIYPYAEFSADHRRDSGNNFYISYPSTQTYAVNSFGKGANKMIAASDERQATNLYFRNACGFLVIKLYGEDVSVKKITLTARNDGDKLAGTARITAYADAAPEIAMAESTTRTVTLDCSNGGAGVALGADAANPTEFWFALPPTTMTTGMKIEVTDTKNRVFVKETTKQITIGRNLVQPMEALKYTENTPGSYKLWYTRPEGQTTPINFGDTTPFSSSIKSHTYQSSEKRFVIEFDDVVKYIYDEAFYKTDITSITLPESLLYIMANSLAKTAITSITIPGSVEFIGVDAFYNCEQLTSVTFEGHPNNKVLDIGYGLSSLHAIIGPFYYSPLRTVNLNRQLNYEDDAGNAFTPTEIDEGYFVTEYNEEGYNLAVTLGSQVTSLEKYMFASMPITEISIPGSVTLIDDFVFDECVALTKVTFEAGDTDLAIGFQPHTDQKSPFYDSPLTTVEIDRNLVLTDAYNAACDGDDEYLFTTDSDALKYVTIGGHATTIFNNMFNECPNIASVTFEEGLQPLTLGYDTDFEHNDYGVGRGPFLNAENLSKVVLNRNIHYTFGQTVDGSYNSIIRASIFNNNHRLTSVTIGDKVTMVPQYAFAGAGFSAGISLPNSLSLIGDYAFYDAHIQTIILPYNLTTIGSRAFAKNSIINLTIPANVAAIGEGAFVENEYSSIVCNPITPPSIGAWPFTYVPIWVPSAAYEAYRSAWSAYAGTIKRIE